MSEDLKKQIEAHLKQAKENREHMDVLLEETKKRMLEFHLTAPHSDSLHKKDTIAILSLTGALMCQQLDSDILWMEVLLDAEKSRERSE